MRRLLEVSLILALLVSAPTSVRAAPTNGNVTLQLSDAVARKGNAYDLDIEFRVRDGKWLGEVWGYAVNYNRGHHTGTVKQFDANGDKVTVTVDVNIKGDNWVPGGDATYKLDLVQDGDRLSGTFTGTYTAATGKPKPKPFKPDPSLPDEVNKMLRKAHEKKHAKDAAEASARATKVSGSVSGIVGPVWPMKVESFRPPAKGEHPRLVFRADDLAAMKEHAKTPEGKAIMNRTLSVLTEAPMPEADKFTTWPAVGYAFAYQMTGDQTYADRAREIVDATIFKNPAGRKGRGISQDIHHAPRLVGLALAYDMACQGWDDAFRKKCIDEIQQRVREVSEGEFGGKGMGGLNLAQWSNHNGIRAGAYGLGALAIMGEENSLGKVMEEAPALADRAAREVRTYITMGLGGSGRGMEGMFYKGMTVRRGLGQFLHAYPKAMGKRVDGGRLGDFMLTGYLLGGEPGRFYPTSRRYDGGGREVDGDDLRAITMSLLMITVPEEWKPGVKTAFDRLFGPEGSETYGIEHGMYAPYVMATYPFDVHAAPMSESLPWIAPDPRKGHYIFRPGLKDENDIRFVANMKDGTLGSSHYERAGIMSEITLVGFAKPWVWGQYLVRPTDKKLKKAENELHGPEILGHTVEGRTCVVDMDLRRAYLERAPKGHKGKTVGWLTSIGRYVDHGIRGRRSLGVDASGDCGAPLLVAIYDRVHDTDGQGLPSRWSLPIAKDAKPVAVAGSRFRIGEGDGPQLAGVLASGQTLADGKIAAEGDGTYLAVFVLTDKVAPEIQVNDPATVRVGKRTVRVQNGSIVFE